MSDGMYEAGERACHERTELLSKLNIVCPYCHRGCRSHMEPRREAVLFYCGECGGRFTIYLEEPFAPLEGAKAEGESAPFRFEERGFCPSCTSYAWTGKHSLDCPLAWLGNQIMQDISEDKCPKK